jgi:xylose dehydrogenase (NAD/NADP)
MQIQNVKWGILSTANIGRKLVIPAFQRSTNSEVVAISSRGEKVYEVAQEMNIPKAYTSYEELLQDSEIDAVYIPLPNHLHKEWVIKAAQAKKHILVEKPAGLTAEEVQDMSQACQENGVIIMEAYMYRFHAQHEKVRKLIQDGVIGEVRMMRGSFSFQMRNANENIRMRPEYGGGSLYDVGCYPINAFRYFLGEPESVYAEAALHENGVDTTAIGILNFANEVKASFDCSFTMHPRNEYEILGTKGSIKVSYAFRPDAHEKGGVIEIYTDNGIEMVHVQDDQYRNQTEHISHCILQGINPDYSIQNTYLNMKVIDATYQSIKEKRKISLN